MPIPQCITALAEQVKNSMSTKDTKIYPLRKRQKGNPPTAAHQNPKSDARYSTLEIPSVSGEVIQTLQNTISFQIMNLVNDRLSQFENSVEERWQEMETFYASKLLELAEEIDWLKSILTHPNSTSSVSETLSTTSSTGKPSLWRCASENPLKETDLMLCRDSPTNSECDSPVPFEVDSLDTNSMISHEREVSTKEPAPAEPIKFPTAPAEGIGSSKDQLTPVESPSVLATQVYKEHSETNEAEDVPRVVFTSNVAALEMQNDKAIFQCGGMQSPTGSTKHVKCNSGLPTESKLEICSEHRVTLHESPFNLTSGFGPRNVPGRDSAIYSQLRASPPLTTVITLDSSDEFVLCESTKCAPSITSEQDNLSSDSLFDFDAKAAQQSFQELFSVDSPFTLSSSEVSASFNVPPRRNSVTQISERPSSVLSTLSSELFSPGQVIELLQGGCHENLLDPSDAPTHGTGTSLTECLESDQGTPEDSIHSATVNNPEGPSVPLNDSDRVKWGSAGR
jgi:hypothetical protein